MTDPTLLTETERMNLIVLITGSIASKTEGVPIHLRTEAVAQGLEDIALAIAEAQAAKTRAAMIREAR